MHLSMQVLLALLAVAIGAISYKASNVIYSCFRNSRLLRDYPGPKYGFFLGVIPHFAGSTPLTRYARSTALGWIMTPHSAGILICRTMQAWVEEYGPVFRMRLLFAHVSYVVASQHLSLYTAWNYQSRLYCRLFVSQTPHWPPRFCRCRRFWTRTGRLW